MLNRIFKRTLIGAGLVALTACGALDRVTDIGSAPDMTPIKDIKAPAIQRSISLPMPDDSPQVFQANSLWRTGARAFFKDQRARRVGDILTVNIAIADKASVANTTAKNRATVEGMGMPNLFGIEKALPYLGTSNKLNADGTPMSASMNAIRNGYDAESLVSANSDSSYAGTGTVDRSETIELTVAAIITDVLPNGNLVIQGRQEDSLNFEKRELLLAGIVRPEDISSTNTIQHTQIAEARISYGGKGQITDVQQPRYGAQLYDIIFQV